MVQERIKDVLMSECEGKLNKGQGVRLFPPSRSARYGSALASSHATTSSINRICVYRRRLGSSSASGNETERVCVCVNCCKKHNVELEWSTLLPWTRLSCIELSSLLLVPYIELTTTVLKTSSQILYAFCKTVHLPSRQSRQSVME